MADGENARCLGSKGRDAALPFAASRVIFGAVPYLVAGFVICTLSYGVLGTLIEYRTKAHVPKRSWWARRPLLEMCRVHRRIYPDSYVVVAFWLAFAAAIAFWIAGAYLQSTQRKEMRIPQALDVELL